jgi:hypothetical protein
MNKQPKPTKNNLTALHQICKIIPTGVVRKLSREHGVEEKCRTFSAWSQVVSLLYAQLVHAIGLNDVCDGLMNHASKLGAIRGATPASRNGLSYANKERNSTMMEALFWEVLSTLQGQFAGFGPSGRYVKLPRRFKKAIHAVDSSTMALVANCMDWAKHRRRKAAAKMHLRLNLQTFLPGFAVIEEASHHDSMRMGALCSALRAGEIVIFDKAYVHFLNLFNLHQRGVFWITRAKENMAYKVHKRLQRGRRGSILRDDLIKLSGAKARAGYPEVLRRVEAEVQINGKTVVMVFITNNLEWAASSICDLYASRWAIETFFKEIKQTLKICDFLGYSKNAIQWQLWAALLLYLLLRFHAWAGKWPHSFKRLFTLVRGVVWDRFNLFEIIEFYGTAGGKWRMRADPGNAYLPGWDPGFYGTA